MSEKEPKALTPKEIEEQRRLEEKKRKRPSMGGGNYSDPKVDNHRTR